jgi:4-diphosphocytidyl-2-C-methyl-D-erythritol kinase
MPLTEIARAKVNLTLAILGQRADGFHELDSLVAFADVGDVLTLEPAAQWQLVSGGLDVAEADNLVTQAMQMYAEAAGRPQPFRLTLEKRLPVAAGIGGGSADAAATLRLLQRAALQPLSGDALQRIAERLGSDVPVCLLNQSSRVTGRGERLAPLADMTPLHAVLVNPRCAVPARKTAEIFKRLQAAPYPPGREPASVRLQAVRTNDLQAPVVAALHRQPGLTIAQMSGAGPTCFGAFTSQQAADTAAGTLMRDHPQWWVVATVLR